MERHIEAHLHRFVGRNRVRTKVWIRTYVTIENAVSRGTNFMIRQGQVGDVIEFVLRKNGDQVAIIFMPLQGDMKVIWNRTEAKRVRSAAILAGLES